MDEDKLADKKNILPDMVADMEVDMVAAMELDNVADKKIDIDNQHGNPNW